MRIFKSSGYQLIPKKNESPTLSETRLPDHSKLNVGWRKLSLAVMLGVVILVLTALSLAHVYRPLSRTETTMMKPCGETPEEAREAGCTFDVMMDEWLPAECYDEALTKEFRQMKDWQFFADKNRTQRLSEKELSQSAKAHTTLDYHVAHCAFALRKFHRAIATGRQIELNVADVGHTDHCAFYLSFMIRRLDAVNHHKARNFSMEDIGTILRPAYPTCIDVKEISKYNRLLRP